MTADMPPSWQLPLNAVTISSTKGTTYEPTFEENKLAWLTRLWLGVIAFSCAGLAFASVPHTQSAASLHAKYASLGEPLHRA